MKYAVLGLVLALCGCPVQVDNVNVDQPMANVNANGTANVNTGAAGSEGIALRDAAVASANEQPALRPAKLAASTLTGDDSADAGVDDEGDAGPAEHDAAVVAPCPDSDQDGVCDANDVCPAGPDIDADHNGYADACEQELASDTISLSMPTTIGAPFDSARPGMAILESWTPNDCYLDGVGLGFVGLPVPQLDGVHPAVVIHPRSMSGQAGKLAECLEAGVQLVSLGGLGSSQDNYEGTQSYGAIVTSSRMFPLLAGKHVTYFKVVATSFWTAQGHPSGTQVGDFQATISVHGY